MEAPISQEQKLNRPVIARPGPPPWWALAVPFLLTLGQGLWGIRREGSLWGDETTTYDMATRTLPDIVAMQTESVHGFYYLFMQGVFGVFGDGLVTLRLPSVLAMSVASAVVAAIGHRLAGPGAGLLAGVLLPLAPVGMQYMQAGRSYALVTALVAVATWLLVRGLDEGRTALWVWYAVVSLTACLCHEFAVLSLTAHGTTLLVARVPWPTVRKWLLAVAGVAVGIAPLAWVTFGQRDMVDWIATPGWHNLFDYPVLVALGVTGAGVLVALRGERGRPVALWVLALPMLLVPTALLLLVSFTIEPLYINRYVLYFVIGFALLAGGGLDRLWTAAARVRWTWPCRAVLVVLTGLLIAGQVPDWISLRRADSRLDDDAAVARAVADLAEQGDGVVFLPLRRREVTQVYPEVFRGLRDVAVAQAPVPSGTAYGVELPADRVRSALLSTDRIVVLRDDPPRGEPMDTRPQEVVKRQTLAAYFRECTVTRVTGVAIATYAKDGHC
ncbi:glycosyltransferase family 39 protein [Saccharopolyspora spinosa]|uniref:Mannosyltransferase n=1 Tax=Saccharopolyspora spinosa TaxID=60894 RepID=A0A2N3Y0X1_SACSN|nr:mannosyltransferase [Saccharopolyspora spinosa]